MLAWAKEGCTGGWLWPTCEQCTPPAGPGELQQYADWMLTSFDPSVTLTNSDAVSTNSFATGLNWANGSVPATTNLNVVSGWRLRTPADAASHTFSGESLTLSNGGSLCLSGTSANSVLTIGRTPATGLFLNQGTVTNGTGVNQQLAGYLTLNPGGGNFYPGGNTLSIPAVVDGLGGVTTLGGGSLVLTNANSYSGATVVNAGKLVVTTASTGAGAFSVADGGTLEVQVAAPGQSLLASSVTLGTSGYLTNNFTLGANGTSGGPVMLSSGALTLNGKVIINVTGSGLLPGIYPLILYGSFAGSGSFITGALPASTIYTASLTNDTANRWLALVCAGTVPVVLTNTQPASAVDVVGSQIAFTAAFGGASPLNYQWQFIHNGITSNLAGATNTTLTLTNLQLANAGSYRLSASNALGSAVSAASPLTVNAVPAAVNNVITDFAAQTGLGSALTNFFPTWTMLPGSLLAGLAPSTLGSGNFSENSAGVVAALTDGSIGWLNYWPGVGSSLAEVTCGTVASGAGQSVIYTLAGSADGYNLTNITVYGGWGDAGRDQQSYTIYYSTVAAPATFLPLSSVNYLPVNTAAVQCATRATLVPANGVLATNVAALKFDFTTPAGENGYEGYAEIAVYGTPLSPVILTNVSPVTAADVVGSQVVFTAAANGVAPLASRWQFISGGVTNILPGATNLNLTLANLQLTNSGAYQLLVSNAYGVVVSSLGTLTVASVPAAVNNVVIAPANQTGTGSGTFTPTWTVTTNNSLIAGQSPGSATGNFSLEVPGRSVNSLTAGGSASLAQITGTAGYTTSTNYVTCGNGGGAGSLVIYPLTGSGSGYNLTNITVYGGWADAGRDQQAYTVYYSTVAAPATYLLLGTVNYQPADPANAQSATRVTLTPASGALATNVASLEFNFASPSSENGYCGYTKINVFGVLTPQAVKWAVGNGNWDTTSSNWKPLAGGTAVNYAENSLAAFDDSASGASTITITLTGNHSPSMLTNNSTKNYFFTGGFGLTCGSLVKLGNSTLTLDNGGTNAYGNVLINGGTLQIGNNDANGSLAWGNVTNNALVVFDHTDTLTLTNPISGSGSLAQSGTGNLVLGAANSYSGSTVIGNGTLVLTGTGSFNSSALISVSNGAVLDVTGRADQTLTLNNGQTLIGSGTVRGNLKTQAGSSLNPGDSIRVLAVQGNVVLGGTLLLNLNRTNNPLGDELVSLAGTIQGGGTLTVLNAGPAVQPGDTFQLFSGPVTGFTTVNLPALTNGNGWTNQLAVNGSIQVLSLLAPNSTNITVQVTGNILTLSWPLDHTGWQLQAQTNNSATGLDTNWVVVTGSTATNLMAIPLDPANNSVFYRLAHP